MQIFDQPVPDQELADELDVAGEARLYRAMRWFWHPVMYASELADSPRGAVLLEEAAGPGPAGGVRCFADLCAHRAQRCPSAGWRATLGRVEGDPSAGWRATPRPGGGRPLGRVEGDETRCAYHSWTYGPDGVSTKIPSRFGGSIRRRARLSPTAWPRPAG